MDKQRKSKAREIYEQAENAGRFAGNDTDAQVAREQAEHKCLRNPRKVIKI